MPKSKNHLLLLTLVFVILSPLQSLMATDDWSVNILITDDQGELRSVFCEGETVNLEATDTCNSTGTRSYSWSPEGSTKTLSLPGLAAGNYTYTVTVTIGNESRSASAGFTVVAVLSIEAEPKVVCVDGEVSYTVTTQPEGYNYMVSYTPADTSTPGIKQVIATCGSSAATCTVTVCDRVLGSVVAVYVKPDEGESVPIGINQAHSGNFNLSVKLCDGAPATTVLITRKLFVVPNGPSITITDSVVLSSPGTTSYSESDTLFVVYSYNAGQIGEHTGTISVKWEALYPGGETVSDDDSNMFIVYVP